MAEELKSAPIGQRIRYWRTVRRLKQLYVAEMCGISTQTLSQIENGRICVKVDNRLRKLRSVLNVTWDELLGDEYEADKSQGSMGR